MLEERNVKEILGWKWKVVMEGWRKINKDNFVNCIKRYRCAHIKDNYNGGAFSFLLTDFVVTP
jgi:hypothetical protein